MNDGFWLRIGAVWGFLAVAMGAFGAHGLRDRLTALDQVANFHTAAQYHMYIALAMVSVGLLQTMGRSGTGAVGRRLVVLDRLGGLLGSLYVLSLTGLKWLGAITPIGGVAILVGWAALAVAAGRSATSTAEVPVAASAGYSKEF